MSSTAPAIRNTSASYGAVAKTFHWLTALLILTAIPLGLIANEWPYDTSAALTTKGVLFSIHKSLGVTVFFVALLRILWALSQPKPGLLNTDRRIETWLAETVHWLLYASLVIVPLSGWLHHAATSGFAPIWWPFGQSLPFVPVDEGVARFFGAWHQVFTKILAASVVLHIAGALKHHWIDRDQTLARMLPGRVAAAGARDAHGRASLWAALGVYGTAIALGSALGLAGGPAVGVQTAALNAAPSQWEVQDGALSISVIQMGSEVTGQFETWSAAINFDPEASGDTKGDVRVEIAISTLSLGSVTGEALKPEFFAAEEYPTAVFAADIVDAEGENAYVATGTLTLKGNEVPVTLPFTLTLDSDTASMSGSTTLDRRNYDIGTASYNDEKSVAFDVSVDVQLTAVRGD